MKKYSIYILLLMSWLSSSAQVEELVLKDSCYTSTVDGVFIDLDSYVEITYELEKVELLKEETPGLRLALDSLKSLHDSASSAYMSENTKMLEVLHLEQKSKTELRQRVFNLQHNYNVMHRRHKRATKQRNSLALGSVALIIGILLL